MFPPIPSWDGLHPLIIHFPIALLLVAPILILLGLISPNRGRAFLGAAVVLMVLGTIASWIAVSTGEAAGELAERATGAGSVLDQHEELAETTRTAFTILTGLFLVILFAPAIFRTRFSQKMLLPANIFFLLLYGSGLVLLVNTAHQGGRLVHEFGIRAMMAPANQTTSERTPSRSHVDDDD